MATREEVLWTVLPAGLGAAADPRFDGGEGEVSPVPRPRYRLSAFVSFRLSKTFSPLEGRGPRPLSEFPRALGWPAVVDQTRFEIEVGGRSGGRFPCSVVSRRRPELWSELFTAATLVRSYQFQDWSGRLVRSFSASQLAGQLASVYSRAAVAELDDPPGQAKLQPIVDVTRLTPVRRQARLGELESRLSHERALGRTGNLDDELHLAWRFFHKRPVDAPPLPPATAPELDFHRMVSLLGPHPAVLRALGLVVDLVVDADPAEVREAAGVTAATGVPVRLVPTSTAPPLPKDSDSDAVDTTPNTLSRLTSDRFDAVPSEGGDFADGFVRLDDGTRFEPLTVDTEGAGAKLMAMGNQPSILGPQVAPLAAALPSLRTDGLAVARVERAVSFRQADLLRPVDLNGSLDQGTYRGEGTALRFDDLVRGFRVDVAVAAEGSDRTPRWRSLMRRDLQHRIGHGHSIDADDVEAYVSTAATRGAGDDDPDDLYVHEAMFHWNGWSLAAQKPAKTIGMDDRVVDRDPEQGRVEGFPFLTVVERPVPGSLPLLRYGLRYLLRARAVDLAGNGVPWTNGDAGHVLGPVPFLRWERVPAPVLLQEGPRTEGETLERIVVRSPAGSPTGPSSRWIAPPRASHELSERHGVFDREVSTPDGPAFTLDPDAYQVAAVMEADGYQNYGVVDPFGPNAGDAEAEAEGAARYYPAERRYRNPVTNATQDRPPVAHLPDPLAVGFQVWRPGGIPLRAGWPAMLPFTASPAAVSPPQDFRVWRLEVVGVRESDGFELEADVERHVVVAHVPAAMSTTVRMTSRFRDGAERLMALFQRLAEDGHDTEGMVRRIREGRHWAFTPYRELTLVHAVHQPLAEPQVLANTARRSRGQTFSVLDHASDGEFSLQPAVTFHRSSTGKLELMAKWSEWIDDGTNADPDEPVVRRAVVAELRRPPADEQGQPDSRMGRSPLGVVRHEHGDTKARRVSYSALATTAFLEAFRVHQPAVLGGEPVVLEAGVATQLSPPSAGGFTPGTVVVQSPDGSVTYRQGPPGEGGDYLVDHDNGTITAHRRPVVLGDGQPPRSLVAPLIPAFGRSSAEVRVSWVPGPASTRSEQLLVTVPGAARPAAPKVHSVLPTWSWERTSEGGVTTHVRKGGGLRVYLERPWWSSGGGELLGVVFLPAYLAGEVDKAEPFVTRWGADPIHATGPTAPVPLMSSFGNDTVSRTSLSVAEIPHRVSVAGHRVRFDPVRDLWYADIELLGVGSYWPFVRLALARFQPDSIDDAHLSAIVTCDFVQLAPDRTVTVRPGSNVGRRLVTVTGPGYRPTPRDSYGSELEVSFEHRPEGGEGAFGWVPLGTDTVLNRTVAVDNSTGASTVTYSGEVSVPRADGLARMVVTEYERARTDPGAGTDGAVVGRRPVFTDTISLPTAIG